jgi:hypothetical protein
MGPRFLNTITLRRSGRRGTECNFALTRRVLAGNLVDESPSSASRHYRASASKRTGRNSRSFNATMACPVRFEAIAGDRFRDFSRDSRWAASAATAKWRLSASKKPRSAERRRLVCDR